MSTGLRKRCCTSMPCPSSGGTPDNASAWNSSASQRKSALARGSRHSVSKCSQPRSASRASSGSGRRFTSSIRSCSAASPRGSSAATGALLRLRRDRVISPSVVAAQAVILTAIELQHLEAPLEQRDGRRTGRDTADWGTARPVDSGRAYQPDTGLHRCCSSRPSSMASPMSCTWNSSKHSSRLCPAISAAISRSGSGWPVISCRRSCARGERHGNARGACSSPGLRQRRRP